MARPIANSGITAAEAADLFEAIEAAERAGFPLRQFLTGSPSQAIPDAERVSMFHDMRKRIGNFCAKRDMKAVALYVPEKKLFDRQNAGLHVHGLLATPTHQTEPILRAITGASVRRVARGTWRSDNGEIDVQLEPNNGPDGIFQRAQYMAKERTKEYQGQVISEGQISSVWRWEPTVEIIVPRLILTPALSRIRDADRDSRTKFYPVATLMSSSSKDTPAPEPQGAPVYLVNSEGQGIFFSEMPEARAPDKPRCAPRRREKLPPPTPMLRLFALVTDNTDVIAAMRALGPTHQQIADHLGLSRPQVTNILNGQFRPSRAVVDRVLAIARAA